MSRLATASRAGGALLLLVGFAFSTPAETPAPASPVPPDSRTAASLPTTVDPDGARGPFTPWKGRPGITETVDQIMAREARLGVSIPRTIRAMREHPPRTGPMLQNPLSPSSAAWPAALEAPSPPVEALGPQTTGVSFKGISLLSPNESSYVPPDSVGDVGPSQLLVGANGRIKVFDRTGALGPLSADLDLFFASVSGGVGITDPQIRFDRLSGRWFVTGLTIVAPNRIVIAVSSGAVISGSSSFTFFFFQQDLVSPAGDTGLFQDYNSLGVDRSALYIGTNTFNAAGTQRMGAAGFVVDKAGLLAGTLAVTAFRGLNTAHSSSGPYSPRGVDDDDPAATFGYFIGVDNAQFGLLVLRRITDPGGSPSISGNINLTVPTTSIPALVPHLGMAAPNRRLDSLDDRLFAARIHRNKLTGQVSLWTAHNILVDSSGAASGTGDRDGSRWYEIQNLDTIPTLLQSGTLFDSAATNPRYFWIPTAAGSGQGHMALGCSTAGVAFRADMGFAGRLSGDPAGTLQSFSPVTAGSTAYNQEAVDGQRWGDYSQTTVDPNDDMTIWTFQEFCDATNSWGVEVAQLMAPPPATPVSADNVCQGSPSAVTKITGSSLSGSGFFDPGSDAGGPGYPNHLSASATGGVTVNGVTLLSPTQISLNVSSVGSALGLADVTVVNPDGQSRSGIGILNVIGEGSPCEDGNTCTAGSTCQGGSCIGGTLLDTDLDTHPSPACGGDDCNDLDSQVWHSPTEVTQLLVSGIAPSNVSWSSQAASAGPETTYDLVSGSTGNLAGINFSAALCLLSGGPAAFSDGRPNPAPGQGFWYLARGRNSCGIGTYGSAARDNTIPSCP